MSRITLSRLGAAILATALVAGGSLAIATPASAAGENTSLANSSYAAGNWAEGITVTGDTYPASTELTIQVGDLDGDLWGETAVTTDATGAFTLPNWIPADGPYAATSPVVIVSYLVDGDPVTAAILELTITAFVPAAQTVTVTPTCSSVTAVNADGVTVVATGFNPKESVSESTTAPDGTPYADVNTLTANASGTVTASFTLLGTIQTGSYLETLAGENGLTLTGSFTVGECGVPVVITPAVAAAPAALAATGAGEAGTIVLGGAFLLLAGTVLLVARRRSVTV